MTRLPELERALVAAAERLEGRTGLRRRRLWRVPLFAGLGSLVLAGGAIAAVALLPTGRPVPAAPKSAATRPLGKAVPRSYDLLPLRVADPGGGPPWGLAVVRRAGGGAFCVQAGRVQGGRLGVLGRDGSFDDDGRFHPLSPGADQGGECAGIAPGGQMYLSTSGPPIPASGYTGSFNSTVGGCRERVPASTMSPETRRRLRGVAVCPAADLRIVRYGFAGRKAAEIELANDRIHLRVHTTAATSGAYLFVLTPPAAGPHPLTLTVTYQDGTVCGDRLPPSRACDPPPGLR